MTQFALPFLAPFASAFTSPATTELFWQGFQSASKATQPVMRNVTQTQAEVSALTSRRARAWLDIPSELAECRSPLDVLLAQTRFWQTAVADYTDANRKLTNSWQAEFVNATKSFSASLEIARDRLEFPDPTAPSQPDAERPASDQRRFDEPRTPPGRDRRHAA